MQRAAAMAIGSGVIVVLLGAAGSPEVRITEHPNGTKASECSYVGETLHGRCTSWFDDGTKQSEGEYVDGLRQGPWVIWVRDDPPQPDSAMSRIIGTTGTSTSGTVADVLADDGPGLLDLDAALVSVDAPAGGGAEPTFPSFDDGEPPRPYNVAGVSLPARYREEGAFERGHRTGTWHGYHESGTRLYEGRWGLTMAPGEDGVWTEIGAPPPEGDPPTRQGIWTTWYRSGSVMRTETYRNGSVHGPVQSFYPTGKERFRGEMEMSVENGPWVYRHKDGTVASQGRWDYSEPHDRWSFHFLGGQVEAEGTFDGGSRTGTWTTYHASGHKRAEGAYEWDQRTGRWTFWRADGSKVAEGAYHEGVPVGTWTGWFEDGREVTQDRGALPGADDLDGG